MVAGLAPRMSAMSRLILPLTTQYSTSASLGVSLKDSASASINADVRFHLLGGSGALVTVTPPPPYRGGWGASYLMPNNYGSAEPFAIMYEIDDKSDSKGIHNALALAGIGDIYRQSKYYAVEADPGRYAALVRAAYRGINAAIVAEMVKSRG